MMICPNCSTRMTNREIHGIAIDTCDSCEGIWFEPGQIEAYYRSAFEDLYASVPPDSYLQSVASLETTHCPKCSACALQSGMARSVPFRSCSSCNGVFLRKRDLPLLAGATKCPRCAEEIPPDRTICISRSCKTRSRIKDFLWAVLGGLGFYLLVWAVATEPRESFSFPYFEVIVTILFTVATLVCAILDGFKGKSQ